MANENTIKREWFVVDAAGKRLGRLATEVATVLRGKHKPTFTPHVDSGDYVIVINAEKIELTGNKWDDKKYYTHSNYPGGLKEKTAKVLMQEKPTRMVELAIKGMLPKGKLGNQMYKKLFVYAGEEHKQQAQKPVVMVLKGQGEKMAKSVMYRGTGRRKSSVARVILRPGNGVITVNGRTFEEYVPSSLARLDVSQPLVLTANENTFDISVNVNGGGIIGQAGAIRLGITRALLEVNPEYRKILKPAGLITRDPRVKERKKYGLKKARRAPQFSKR